MTRTYYRPDGYTRKKQNRWYLSLIIVMIPLFIFCTSFNMVTRVSDVYKYQLNANTKALAEDEKAKVKTLETENIYLEEAVFADEISAYINGSADKIEVADTENELYEYYEAMASKVTDNDYAGLKALSKADLVLLILGIISFIGSVILCWQLIADGYEGKAELRDKVKKCAPVLAGLEILMFICAGIAPIRKFINGKLLGVAYVKGDLLIKLLGTGIYLRMAAFILLLSVIIGAVVVYILWVLTKPRDTFNERRYFR